MELVKSIVVTTNENFLCKHFLLFLQHLQTENDTLKKTLEKVQSQLETSLEAQDQQRKVLDAINRQFGDHLHALGELQNELSAVLNT